MTDLESLMQSAPLALMDTFFETPSWNLKFSTLHKLNKRTHADSYITSGRLWCLHVNNLPRQFTGFKVLKVFVCTKKPATLAAFHLLDSSQEH